MNSKLDQYPGGSKTRVNKAGDAVRSGNPSENDLSVIDNWRAAHREVVNTFQANLRRRAKDKKITVAQRHKRKKTIFDKLIRFPKMLLSRMDDIAGCRLIFRSIKDLNQFRSEFHKARFKHNRKNDPDKYNYIKTPKPDGYRGIHDVYEYNVNSIQGINLKGLNVEVQYRTLPQHAWATAVEVIGFITTSQPKFKTGDKRYEEAMILASEIIARTEEKESGPLPQISNSQLGRDFKKLDRELSLLITLKGLKAAKKDVSDRRNTILIFHLDGRLEIKSFRDSPEALVELFRLEKTLPNSDVVLVKSDTSEGVREAFRNYFSDAQDFVKLVENGLEKLKISQPMQVNLF